MLATRTALTAWSLDSPAWVAALVRLKGVGAPILVLFPRPGPVPFSTSFSSSPHRRMARARIPSAALGAKPRSAPIPDARSPGWPGMGCCSDWPLPPIRVPPVPRLFLAAKESMLFTLDAGCAEGGRGAFGGRVERMGGCFAKVGFWKAGERPSTSRRGRMGCGYQPERRHALADQRGERNGGSGKDRCYSTRTQYGSRLSAIEPLSLVARGHNFVSSSGLSSGLPMRPIGPGDAPRRV